MRDLLTAAAGRAIRYLETLDARPVSPTPQAIAALSQLDEPLPDMPDDPAAILARLDEIGSPASMAMAGRRFFGWVIGGSLPAALAANWLATAWIRMPRVLSRHRASRRSRKSPCAGSWRP